MAKISSMMCIDGVYIGSMQGKQATCGVVFLQGYHVFKHCRNILKPVANPQNGNGFKTFPNRTFSNKKCMSSAGQQVSLDHCLRKSKDYFKTDYRGAEKPK